MLRPLLFLSYFVDNKEAASALPRINLQESSHSLFLLSVIAADFAMCRNYYFADSKFDRQWNQ